MILGDFKNNCDSYIFENDNDNYSNNTQSKNFKIFLIVLSVFLFITILLLILYFTKRNRDSEGFSETTCVCVFDLDNTITCGLENAKSAVEECRKRGCKMAINTARQIPYYEDIKLDKLGLSEKEIKENFYHGDWIEGLISTMNREELTKHIAETKTKHLETIKEKYNVPKERIILFDDVYDNVKDAENNGFKAIHANSPTCGLDQYIRSDISNILDK